MPFETLFSADFSIRPFDIFDHGWALLSAGNAEHHNTMTVSWGGLGTLWNLPVATIVCRPQRFTYQFLESNSHFSLSFFDGDCHKALTHLGSHSGRDGDKIAESGLTRCFDAETDTLYFEEAAAVLFCRKLYASDLHENCFTDTEIAARHYPNHDFHRMYIGAVLRILRRTDSSQ